MKIRTAGLAAALLLSFATHAQTPATTPATVLKAAHLFDGRSGTLVSPGLVVVQGSRILAVGPDAGIPAGARVIELGDVLQDIRATERPLMVMKQGVVVTPPAP